MLLILLFRHEREVDRLKSVCVEASEELHMLLETPARNWMKEIGVCANASRFACVTGTPCSCQCRRSAVAILNSRSVFCRRRYVCELQLFSIHYKWNVADRFETGRHESVCVQEAIHTQTFSFIISRENLFAPSPSFGLCPVQSKRQTASLTAVNDN
ncbi:hypothetical protein AVEN_195285-1 [Araneus ventricosus]|uniref:Uncharacterized protein n=1 Tax=Araneus ventricosus TaxID=182803 RepID=A0A4Y2G120_ARAVE|nr:hypothetical protein AVEN_195285-1 [Araneus ventricosus]